MEVKFTTAILIYDWVKVPTMVGGKENFSKTQTSKTAISLFFDEFFNNLFSVKY